ncbi:helix-hairpin-helix domain-containing protein [Marinomonas sp. 15G1-11]|uniref:Helix-hairpin-helix domain-containing protein n=1 Tax=Marinomonas phaeophyticola TaxID=3004091 RepID=A0ABT4JP03_9GAMM|nr:helix-hairpin-helix domain-containing protein [Marinomonas sp. 15G1-11]MCZ2720098.1 helix-hairpin-helix domain-containing protein [Marinomonas sp. 15G1-11]
MNIGMKPSTFFFSTVKLLTFWCVLIPSFFVNAYAVSPLNINTASVKQLSAVMSGVGDAKAKAIIAFRDQNGPFESIDDLTKVKGIGSALINRNREFISVKDSEVHPKNDIQEAGTE